MSHQPANLSQQAGPQAGSFRATVQRGRPGDIRIEKAQNPRHALVRLLPYLRPYRGTLAFVFGLILIYTLLAEQ